MDKVAVIMCNDMHMDIENANNLLAKIKKSKTAQIETDYTKADMIIVITCAFGNGKLKSMQIVSDVETNMKSTAKLILTGCMVRTNRELLNKVSNAIVVELSQVMELFSKTDSIYSSIDDSVFSTESTEGIETTETSNVDLVIPRANTTETLIPQNKVIISSGCLKKCSYCVYPNIQSKYVSKPKEQVLAEVEKMYENETTIYITGGLETSDYGIDLYHGKEYNIAKLVKEICTSYPNCNYIIGWFHPAGLTDEFISVLEECKNIIEIMVHIQHVSDHVLKSMHRPSFSFTDGRIRKIKEVRPDIAISTEVIVGFPGETEEDFIQLMRYLDKGYFYDIGVASYEQVSNTPAAELQQIPFEIRMERMNILLMRYKGASSYPSPKVEEEQLENLYLNSKNKMTEYKWLMLKPEARQQYKYVAGTDTSLKLNMETIFQIYETVLNARDELEISRVKAEIDMLYTKEFRFYMFQVFCNAIKKPAIIERVRRILLN